ncbi:MAG: isoprenylcysteine carboxylmethyltransferase family protein [Flavobacteriaceae bacterium]
MKLRILPPLVMLIFGCFMYGLNRFLPFGNFDFFGRRALTIVLFALGFLVMAIALFQFSRAKTTTNPINLTKTSSLVTNGIFRYTRNPMYLGMLLLLLGFGLKLGNAFNTLLTAGFVYYMNHFQIENEEKALMKLFDKEFRMYCKTTRRWF